jgi:hypothetical protein
MNPPCHDRRLLLASAMFLGWTGCAPKAPDLRAPPSGPFLVSDYFAPSGAFGDGATPGNVVINENVGCKDRPSGARGHCFSFVYQAIVPYVDPHSGNTGSCNFAGVFWQSPPNNWGTDPGLPIDTAFSKLNRVAFFAAVASGPQPVTFGAGGIGQVPGSPACFACPPPTVPAGPYYDQIGLPGCATPPPMTVGTDWARFEIPIAPRTTPVTTLLGAFSWATAWSGQPVTVYIDDLAYEGDGADGGS